MDSKYDRWLLVLGIIFIAATLRAPFTSVGPLIQLIQDDLGLSNTLAGAITTLPLLAFAILSPFAPKLARRFGLANVLLVAMVMLAMGILIRSGSGAGLLFTGTAILGLSIAVCNVLLPGLIKGKFPHKIGLMTGIYTVSMNLCAAIASGISVPLATNAGFGWRGTLAIWFMIAALATVFWIPQIRKLNQGMALRVQPQAKICGVHLLLGKSRSLWAYSHCFITSLLPGFRFSSVNGECRRVMRVGFSRSCNWHSYPLLSSYRCGQAG